MSLLLNLDSENYSYRTDSLPAFRYRHQAINFLYENPDLFPANATLDLAPKDPPSLEAAFFQLQEVIHSNKRYFNHALTKELEFTGGFHEDAESDLITALRIFTGTFNGLDEYPLAFYNQEGIFDLSLLATSLADTLKFPIFLSNIGGTKTERTKKVGINNTTRSRFILGINDDLTQMLYTRVLYGETGFSEQVAQYRDVEANLREIIPDTYDIFMFFAANAELVGYDGTDPQLQTQLHPAQRMGLLNALNAIQSVHLKHTRNPYIARLKTALSPQLDLLNKIMPNISTTAIALEQFFTVDALNQLFEQVNPTQT